jgi:hypothetical protein
MYKCGGPFTNLSSLIPIPIFAFFYGLTKVPGFGKVVIQLLCEDFFIVLCERGPCFWR